MKPLTPEQEKDVETRRESFKKDLEVLSEKHQFTIIAYPQFIPNRDGHFHTGATTILVDLKYLPTPSPMQTEQVIKEQ